jgi:hypothetical protein
MKNAERRMQNGKTKPNGLEARSLRSLRSVGMTARGGDRRRG